MTPSSLKQEFEVACFKEAEACAKRGEIFDGCLWAYIAGLKKAVEIAKKTLDNEGCNSANMVSGSVKKAILSAVKELEQ